MTHLSNTGASSSTAAAAGSSQVNVPEVSATEQMMDFSDMVDVDMTKACAYL